MVCLRTNLIKLHSIAVPRGERGFDLLPCRSSWEHTASLHWQEAHRPAPPVAETGGAPYKEVKYFPPDKCVYPPITAYHKLVAPGPCMGCVRTSAKLQKGSVVVWSTSQQHLWHLAHNCRVTHLVCLEINASFIYSPNVLVITFPLLLKTGFLLFFFLRALLCNLLCTCKWVIRLHPSVCRVRVNVQETIPPQEEQNMFRLFEDRTIWKRVFEVKSNTGVWPP